MSQTSRWISLSLVLSACSPSLSETDASTADSGPLREDVSLSSDAEAAVFADGSIDTPSPQDATTASDAGPQSDSAPTSDVPGDVPGDVAVSPGSSPTIAGCRMLPPDNALNQDISRAPLHPQSATYIAAMNPTRAMHADWGDWSTNHYGIPWQTGMGAAPVAMQWTTSWGPRESEMRPCPGGMGAFCYPIATSARIEGGPSASAASDRHVLYLDRAGAPNNCTLYELYNAQNFTSPPWRAANGAIFDLSTNALRMDQWTSADAAGLPILPTIVRVDEVLEGAIRHAIRFTMARTGRAFIHPATHAAGTAGTNLPPMGLRLRLRAAFDDSRLTPATRVIIRAMKTYGIILADNGSDWFITGDSDDRWSPLINEINRGLGSVRGMDFEVVNTGPTIPQG